MAAGVLQSDHINYLILRYLQEAGHENAAEALYRDWSRPHEYRDPEEYPFAERVKRHELISVVQEGLRHDEMRSRVSENGRQFLWTLDDGSTKNGTGGARTSMGMWKKHRGSAIRAPDEFPTPAPKRQRRSEGSEGVHLNGACDAMELDPFSMRDVDGEDDGDADAIPSPALGSEIEIVEVPERYDSMDVATQTAAQTGPKMTTIYWKVDKPTSTIYHSIWNPDSTQKNSNMLLTVGEDLCRFYGVPDTATDASEMVQIDNPNLPANSVVSATAWHPKGHTTTCAVYTNRELPDGQQKSEQVLINHHSENGSSILPPGMNRLEPSAIVLCIRYSADGRHILVLRNNNKRGLVQIWKTPENDEAPAEPIAWRVFEHQVFDACWRTDAAFVVCGEALINMYQLDDSKRIYEGFTAETIAMQGLSETSALDGTSEKTWERVRVHGPAGPAIVAANNDSRAMLIFGGERFENRFEQALPEGQVSSIAFSSATCENDGRTLLAASYVEGFCKVYAIPKDTSDIENKRPEDITLELGSGPALAAAWSPNGKYLAVSGTDRVQIWQEDAITKALFPASVNGDEETAKPVRSPVAEPFVIWRADTSNWGTPRNGEVNGTMKDTDVEPSLNWSADGESLSLAVDKKLAIIRFRPQLNQEPTEPVETNGNHTES